MKKQEKTAIAIHDNEFTEQVKKLVKIKYHLKNADISFDLQSMDYDLKPEAVKRLTVLFGIYAELGNVAGVSHRICSFRVPVANAEPFIQKMLEVITNPENFVARF